jgi:hypothetical protein
VKYLGQQGLDTSGLWKFVASPAVGPTEIC